MSMRKPDFSPEYQLMLLNKVVTEAYCQDEQYWKETIQDVFKEAEARFRQDPVEYESYDYGYSLRNDVESLLEDYDDNGI